MPELARKGKASHFWCGYCGIEWLIMRKERSWSVSIRRNKQFGKIENPYHQRQHASDGYQNIMIYG
jgi:hypothetical protein